MLSFRRVRRRSRTEPSARTTCAPSCGQAARHACRRKNCKSGDAGSAQSGGLAGGRDSADSAGRREEWAKKVRQSAA